MHRRLVGVERGYSLLFPLLLLCSLSSSLRLPLLLQLLLGSTARRTVRVFLRVH